MNRASLIAISFFFMLACGGDKVSSVAPAPVVIAPTSLSVSVSPVIQTIPPGQTARLIATARYSDGSTKDVTSQAIWTSSQTNVATVSAGAVTGVSLGRTVIRVNFERWSSSETIVIEPDGTFILKGTVTEPTGVGVDGASVEVISGPPNQVMTDSFGSYELFGVAGTFVLRMGKTGYFDERRTVTMSADRFLFVELTPRFAPAGVAGTYQVTFTASASCMILAAEQKTRSYTAQIDQDAARLLITLSGASFFARQNTFSGKVIGDTVTFYLGDGRTHHDSIGGAIEELLSNGQIVGIFGTMTAPATPQSISGTLVGGFTLKTGNQITSCSAVDNQVVFTRR